LQREEPLHPLQPTVDSARSRQTETKPRKPQQQALAWKIGQRSQRLVWKLLLEVGQTASLQVPLGVSDLGKSVAAVVAVVAVVVSSRLSSSWQARYSPASASIEPLGP